jgi:hypothetical protein
MQFIALMRIAIVAAQRRSEIIGNWLWCLRNEGARKRGAPTPSPEEREVKRHSRNPSRVSTALPVRTGLFSVQASPTLSHATPSRAVTPLPPMSIPAALTPVAPPAAPSTAKTAPPTNGQAQRWSATQERIGRWRCDVEDPAPRLAASDI